MLACGLGTPRQNEHSSSLDIKTLVTAISLPATQLCKPINSIHSEVKNSQKTSESTLTLEQKNTHPAGTEG